MQAGGAAFAAGGPGIALPDRADAAESGAAARLLPSFGGPTHLDVADVSSLGGADQLLLTTLQGVVNRRRPRLYFNFDAGEVDLRWLPSTGASVTRHDDALDLFARYRGETRGAVLHDPAVPDSVNVATTLAGLENAVVATAEQARDHRLRTVADLRGRFDADDVLSTYRWQLDRLFPRCAHTLLAGLPPTRTVRNEGVRWREIARETGRVRDASNRQVRTFDLSAELSGGDALYLRFQDSLGDDGWGASVGSVEVTADGGRVIASFVPGTPAEVPYLFDGSGSSIGDNANRFCDGNGSFVYRFTPEAGTRQLSVEVDLWNQFLVSVTNTPPTRVEPFPYFRDYAVASRAMVLWLPPSGDTGKLLDEIFGRVEPTTPYAGWFSDDVAGEWGGVDRASRHGVEVVPADFYMNGTVHAGVPTKVPDKITPRRRAALRNRVHLTLTVGEGDNIQYCQRRMRTIWDDPERGRFPVNWTVSPLLADIGPALLAHYRNTATDNDLLIAGPSGAGYTYPGSWPESALDAYTELTGRFLRRTGMDLVHAYNPRTAEGDGWIPFDERVARSYRENTPVRGIIQSWETGDLQTRPAGLPVIGNFYPQGKAAEYRDGLLRHIEGWDGTAPLFIAGAVNAWSWTPGDIAELCDLLGDPFEVVRGDTFFDLLDRAGRRA
ncbi:MULTISPECIES: GxGYxYP domain-containing protein [Streptomyces]|uniref:GxGYxYP family putative glycoside hydrolase n=1 Tax=Streptomyces glycanivorans TaxID=3033808 RepID=A0ABY9J8I0_9ACTN|nr:MULTISPECIES: GxGYxYP domain-containing protein [unclassified Streptomyces]WLQ62427.1 GxGYxYP family putative glycoside hydrolase [Streptomyces sp. Alt3]WSQ75935.1 GxGYxYP family putative glycoside hydrolase [Streptomyces sp. NBC_01213]WSQ83182.1 GxGYxYP family putative glycoside hydrolase [Streptomyces sp. NBC_01212]